MRDGNPNRDEFARKRMSAAKGRIALDHRRELPQFNFRIRR